MEALVFLSILFVIVFFLLGWSFISYWQRRRVEKKRRQKLLKELAPWLNRLKDMNDEQFKQEFRRIRNLWMETRVSVEMLELQFNLVCQEDERRREAHYQVLHKNPNLRHAGKFRIMS